MKVSPQQLMDDGYLILREVIPREQLDQLRASYDALVERQGGQAWLAGGRQPRLTTNHVVDAATANTVEFWLHENTLGVSRQLMRGPEAAVTEMWVMCSPIRDHGPAEWHRDFDAANMAPLQGLQMDLLENGPAYVQWNIPLYDDNVLWVVPGSFRRPNTEAENRQLRENPRQPLPGGIPVELNAGDGVVYINLNHHWGSNYGARLRRTIHGGYRSVGGPLYPYNPQSCNWDLDRDMGFSQSLSPAARQTFAGWAGLLAQERNLVEATLRTVLDQDAATFRARLAELHPGAKGRIVCVILLSKLANKIRALQRPDVANLPLDERARAISVNVPMCCFYDDLARRFSLSEADALWQRFAALDAKLQADTPQEVPGRPERSSHYFTYAMPANLDSEDFIASWG